MGKVRYAQDEADINEQLKILGEDKTLVLSRSGQQPGGYVARRKGGFFIF